LFRRHREFLLTSNVGKKVLAGKSSDTFGRNLIFLRMENH